MKVLVVVSALLGVSAALYGGNPIAYGTLPYAGAGLPYTAGLGYARAALPYSAGLGYARAALPYSAGLGYARAALPYSAGLGYARAALPYAAGLGYAGIRPYAAVARPAALAYAAPAAVSSQYQAQDELGQYRYGYSGPLSAKTETKNALGGTTGAYSYVDANGQKQTVTYVADAGGFRVKATNLPVAPEANLVAPTHTLVGPAPVSDTAEVSAAKAEFQQLYDEAAAAAAAAPDARRRRSLEEPVAPEDTPSVKAAKALHAQLYQAAELRAAGVAVPTPVLLDTPAVALEKIRHAALYNQAAVRAAVSPDFTSPYGYAAYGYGAGLRSGLLGARGFVL